MKFEIQAVIAEIGQVETVGQNGFQKRNLILTEQNGEYVNPVCIEWSGEKLARPESHQVGQMVKVSGFINCREWEGRYFTSLAGSYMENVNTGHEQQSPAFGTQQAIPQQQAPVAQQPIAQQQVYQAPQPVQQPLYAPQQPQQAMQPQMPQGQPQVDVNGNPLPF